MSEGICRHGHMICMLCHFTPPMDPADAVSNDVVERVARAIYDAIDPNSGDPIAVTIHCTEHIPSHGTIKEQLEQVMDTCRSADRAAISAYNGEG